ncbi:MAG: hypothetical protein U0168_01850 [Nannocystaceae bacterium]
MLGTPEPTFEGPHSATEDRILATELDLGLEVAPEMEPAQLSPIGVDDEVGLGAIAADAPVKLVAENLADDGGAAFGRDQIRYSVRRCASRCGTRR